MKKALIIISAILLSVPASSQWISDWFLARNYYRLGDTTVSVMYSDTLVNPAFVRDYVQNNSPAVTADSFYIKGQNEWIKTNENDTIYKIDTALYALNASSGDSVFVVVTGTDSVKSALFYGDSADITKGKFDSVKIEGIDNAFIYSSASETSDLYVSNDGTNLLIKDNGSITFNSVGGFGLNTSSLVLSTLGTSKTAGAVYSGTEDPTNTTRSNYDGNWHAKELVSDTARSSVVYTEKVSADTFNLDGEDITGTLDPKEWLEGEEFTQFNFKDTAFSGHSEGRLQYNESTKTLVFQNDISGFNHNLGYEFVRRVYNGTGATIPSLRAVRRVGTHNNGDIIASVDLAGNSSRDSSKVYGITTVSIAPGAIGIVTRGGDIRGENTASISDTTVYLGFAGVLVDTCPSPPYFCVPLGECIYSDNDSGQVDIDIKEVTYSPFPAYSASFYDSSITITNPGVNTYALITNASDSLFGERLNYGFVRQGDSIRPLQNGLYDVGISYSAYASAVQTDVYNLGVFVNGVLEHKQTRSFSQNSYGGVPFEIPITLTSSDWISFRIENTDDGTRSAIFVDAVISLEYLTSE